MTSEPFQPVGAHVRVWGLPDSPGNKKFWVELRERRLRKKGYALHLYDEEGDARPRSYPMHDRYVSGICWGGRYRDGIHTYYLAIVFPKTTLLLEPAVDDLPSRNEHRRLGIEIALRLKQDQWWNINILANNVISSGPGCLHIGRQYLSISRRDEWAIPHHEASWVLKDVVRVESDGDETVKIIIMAEQEEMVGVTFALQEISFVLQEADPKTVSTVFNRRKSSRRKPRLPERPNKELRPKVFLRPHRPHVCPDPPPCLPALHDTGEAVSRMEQPHPSHSQPSSTLSYDSGATPSSSDYPVSSQVRTPPPTPDAQDPGPPGGATGDYGSDESEEEEEEVDESSPRDSYKFYDENMAMCASWESSYYTLGNMQHLSTVLETLHADKIQPAERCNIYVNVNQDDEESESAFDDDGQPIYHPLFVMARALKTHRRRAVPNLLKLSSNLKNEFGLLLTKTGMSDTRNDWKCLGGAMGVDDGTLDRIEMLDCTKKLDYTCGELLMMYWEYYSQRQSSEVGSTLAKCDRRTLRELFLRIDRYDLACKLDKYSGVKSSPGRPVNLGDVGANGQT